MKKNEEYEYVGSYLLGELPIWATAFLLFMATFGVVFILRDRCEGVYYNTSYSATLGDGALFAIVIMAVEILKRREKNWLPGPPYHIVGACVAVIFGLIWWVFDRPEQRADIYHHLVIAPLLCYLGITLLPVIIKDGRMAEVVVAACLILVWAGLCVYDAKTDRLSQRSYYNLGRHVDAIKGEKNLKKYGAENQK